MRYPHLARLFLLLVLLVAGLGASGSQTAATAPSALKFTVVAPSGSQSLTAPLDVQVTVSGAAALGAYEFDLEYERALVQVTGVTLSPFLGAVTGCAPQTQRCAVVLGPVQTDRGAGVGAYSYGAGAGATGDGTLVVLHLRPTGLNGTTALHLTNALVTDVSAAPAQPSTEDGTLVFGTGLQQLYMPAVLRR